MSLIQEFLVYQTKLGTHSQRQAPAQMSLSSKIKIFQLNFTPTRKEVILHA